MSRNREIVRVSIYGIIVNIVLAFFKATVGIIAGSISIVLDAVNNLTDVLSSVVTILGVKLADKRPDWRHPFGHGRMEYFSAATVAMIVLAAGLVALRESIEKIISLEEANYSVASLAVVAVAIVVKFYFGRYLKNKGQELNSTSLKASGVDAISDAALSFSVLTGALISMIWHVSLEGYIGLLIAAMIIKTAVGILRGSINDLIGARVDERLAVRVEKNIREHAEVYEVYGLALHNYGPNRIIANAYIEVDGGLPVQKIHYLLRSIETEIYEKFGIILTLGVYASDESDEFKKIKKQVEKILVDYPMAKRIYGLYMDERIKAVTFNLVFSPEDNNVDMEIAEIRQKVGELLPGYKVFIIRDIETA